jgi:hypothetical protein
MLFFLCCLIGSKAYSQSNAEDLFAKNDTLNALLNLLQKQQDSAFENRSYFKIGATYLSNSVYNGRKDSVPISYFTPSISFNHKSGIYANTSLSYQTNAARIDVINVELGYNFDWNKKLSQSVFLGRSFFNDSSSNVQSSYKGYAGFAITYNNAYFNLSNYTNINFGNKTDWALNFTIDKNIVLNKSETWSLNPALTFNFATNNLSPQNYIRQTNKRVTTTIESVKNNKFNLLSCDINASLSYEKNNFSLHLSPYYTIALSPFEANFKSTTKRPGQQDVTRYYSYKETIENTFYIELGFSYKIFTSKKATINTALDELF